VSFLDAVGCKQARCQPNADEAPLTHVVVPLDPWVLHN
jgi:hypothetical protein